MVTTLQRMSVDQVLADLVKEVGSEFAIVPIVTRVVLRTGVNLKQPRPDQRNDKAAIQKAVSALNEMGYLL
jgi:hypothetical protein